jgi:hypothetical protein
MVLEPDVQVRDALWNAIHSHRWLISEYLRKQLISGGKAQHIGVRLDPETRTDGREHFRGFATFEEPRSRGPAQPDAAAEIPERSDGVPPPATVFILDTIWLPTGDVSLKAVETRCGEVRRYVTTLKPNLLGPKGTYAGELMCTQGPGIRDEAQRVGTLELRVLR